VALPAFAAVRRTAADRRPVGRAAIDLLAAGPTAANQQQRREAGEWDRRTDEHPTVAYRPAASIYYAGRAENIDMRTGRER